jgi:CRISPR-associated protein Csm5
MIVKTISPLHIGSGNELMPSDFVVRGDRVYVIDADKVFNELVKIGVYDLLEFEKYPMEGIIEKYNLNLENVSLYSIKFECEKAKESMRIREFIKCNNIPYIPATSVKGAIRTALMYYVLKENDVLLDEGIKMALRTNPKRADDYLEAKIFGYVEDRRGLRHDGKFDILRALIVRDSDLIDLDKLKVKLVDVVNNRGSVPVRCEVLEDVSVEMEMFIDYDLLDNLTFNGEIDNVNFDEKFLKNAIREFANDLIDVELREVYKFGKYKDKVRDFYVNLKQRIKNGELLLKLGWGVGYYGVSIGLLLKGHPKFYTLRKKFGLGKNPKKGFLVNNFPLTRRVCNSQPMGWVKLEI